MDFVDENSDIDRSPINAQKNMHSVSEEFFATEAVVSVVLSFLDIVSLGRAEQISCQTRIAAQVAWKRHAQKLQADFSVRDHSVEANFKEQVRRYCKARNYTRFCVKEHRRHYMQAVMYSPPTHEPQRPPNCSHCTSYPNLKTGVLLSQNVSNYAYFVQFNALIRQGAQTVASVLYEGFLPVQEILPTPKGKYVTLQLNLRNRLTMKNWPSLSYFLDGCRRQPPIEMHSVWFPTFSKQLLPKLEVAITAVHLVTGVPSLLLGTGGGSVSSPDLLHWRLFCRTADAHPTRPAMAFGLCPTVGARLRFLSDYSDLEALEISVSVD